MNASTLATPTMIALLLLVPASGVLAGFGRRGVLAAIILVALLATANWMIAQRASEFAELGALMTLGAVFVVPIMLLIGWHLGEFLRERRASPGKRHRLIGEGLQ